MQPADHERLARAVADRLQGKPAGTTLADDIRAAALEEGIQMEPADVEALEKAIVLHVQEDLERETP